MNRYLKSTLILAAAALVVLALVTSLRPESLEVSTARTETGPFTVSVEERGRSRARLPYTVHAPVSGQLQRPDLLEGERVNAGDVMARIAMARENPRTEAGLRANLESSRAREAAAEAAVRDAESALERARREAERRERLFAQGLIGAEERDLFAQSLDAAEARLLNTRASLSAARADVETARALLLGIDNGLDDEATIPVHAPGDGTVFRVFERSERVVQAGAPLFSVSNDDALELVVDLLTQDAVRVRPGDRIQISGWGGDEILEGRVSYIEPEAFTRVSALGVEEQRVNVIGELIDSSPSLGAEYRIEARIITREEDNILTVPGSALFRRGGQWQVFTVEEGRARLQAVTIGERNRERAEVLSGLEAGADVILFPSDQVTDGRRVNPLP